MISPELLEKLRQVDEVTLLELLDISTDELVDAFLDKIEDRYSFICSQIYD